MRFLGIDYGSKRVGIAVSDLDGKFAVPVVVLKNSKNGHADLLKQIIDIAKENQVEQIVLGESRDFKGKPNAIMEDSLILKKELESAKYKVILEPEFMTTIQAERFQGKIADIDASAAAIILQSYLDREVGQVNK